MPPRLRDLRSSWRGSHRSSASRARERRERSGTRLRAAPPLNEFLAVDRAVTVEVDGIEPGALLVGGKLRAQVLQELLDRKSTRLNSSHVKISYAVFCLKKKNTTNTE